MVTQIVKNNLMDNRRCLVVMRGVPGSGKSTAARELYNTVKNGCLIDNTGVVKTFSAAICSTDDVCTSLNGGKYIFDPKMLGLYHGINQDIARSCMIKRIDCIIVDNTNIKHRDFAKYAEYASLYGYDVVQYIVGEFDFENRPEIAHTYAGRNTHGVPLHTILRMGAQFQK